MMVMEDKRVEIKKNITELFDKVAPVFDGNGPRFFSYFGEKLVEFAEVSKGEKVLDVATGKGASLFSASKLVGDNGEVIGVDISQGMVNETNLEIEKRGVKNAKIMVMDAENLTFSDEIFDKILCGFGIFFFPDYKASLNEFSRVLKKDGKVGFTTFLRKRDEKFLWLDDITYKYLPKYDNELDEYQESDKPEFDTEEGLYKILNESGFKNIKILKEEKDFMYKDEEEWWAKLSTHGAIRVLEAIPKDKFEDFKGEIFEKLKSMKGPEGIPATMYVLYAFGTK